MAKQITERFFCDFCGAENLESQFTKVEIRGCIGGPEMSCPGCLRDILIFLQSLRGRGPRKQGRGPRKQGREQPRRRWWQRFEDWVNNA